MSTFTPKMRAELEDLRSEIPRCIPEEYQEECLRTILNQKRLFDGGTSWENWTPSFANRLHGTWVMTVASSIVEEGGNEWMIDKADSESFDHPLKTVARMEEVSRVSGLARILFTSTVRLGWIHPLCKAYWYALSRAENEDEYPHSAETVIPFGVRLSVFDHDQAPGA